MVEVAYLSLPEAGKKVGLGYSGIERWVTRGVYGLDPIPTVRIGKVQGVQESVLHEYAEKVRAREDGRTKRHREDVDE